MNSFLLDASALAKRYHPEIGSDRLDHLFAKAGAERLMALMLGAAEVVSVLVRRRNAGHISAAHCSSQIHSLRGEVIDATDFATLEADNLVISRSVGLIERYSINSTDAIVLQTSLDVAASLRSAGNDLVLVTSDQRLVKTAQAEGLLTFDPETQAQTDLDPLLATGATP